MLTLETVIPKIQQLQVFFELAGLWKNKEINTNSLHMEA